MLISMWKHMVITRSLYHETMTPKIQYEREMCSCWGFCVKFILTNRRHHNWQPITVSRWELQWSLLVSSAGSRSRNSTQFPAICEIFKTGFRLERIHSHEILDHFLDKMWNILKSLDAFYGFQYNFEIMGIYCNLNFILPFKSHVNACIVSL